MTYLAAPACALAATDRLLHLSGGWRRFLPVLFSFGLTAAAAVLVLGPLELVWLLSGRPTLEQWR